MPLVQGSHLENCCARQWWDEEEGATREGLSEEVTPSWDLNDKEEATIQRSRDSMGTGESGEAYTTLPQMIFLSAECNIGCQKSSSIHRTPPPPPCI